MQSIIGPRQNHLSFHIHYLVFSKPIPIHLLGLLYILYGTYFGNPFVTPFRFKIAPVWQYGLWSFQTGGSKLERFLPKNQHAKRIFLNFENWNNGESQ